MDCDTALNFWRKTHAGGSGGNVGVEAVARSTPDGYTVGLGGIATAHDALEFILAGATAIQVGTASFINPSAAQTIAEDMEAWMRAQGETDIRNLIGALKV